MRGSIQILVSEGGLILNVVVNQMEKVVIVAIVVIVVIAIGAFISKKKKD